MFVTLVRHGDARPPSNSLDDAARALSPRGREQARETARALAPQGVTLTHAWSSPLVRAIQTAELMIPILGFEGSLEIRDDLYPDSMPRSLVLDLDALDANADVLVIGHMPYMAALANELLGMHVGGFVTGGALRIEMRAGNRATPVWRS